MCFAASYSYLKSAFVIITDLLEDNKTTQPYLWWILIQAYETACFWRMIFSNFLKKDFNDSKCKLLNDFLLEEDLKEFVKNEYLDFDRFILNGENEVEGRIKSFETIFGIAQQKPKKIGSMN